MELMDWMDEESAPDRFHRIEEKHYDKLGNIRITCSIKRDYGEDERQNEDYEKVSHVNSSNKDKVDVLMESIKKIISTALAGEVTQQWADDHLSSTLVFTPGNSNKTSEKLMLLQEILHSLNEQVMEDENLRTSMKNKISEMENSLKEKDKKMEKCNEIKNKLESMQIQMVGLTKELETLRNKNDELTKERDSFKIEVSKLKYSLHSAENEREALQKKLAMLKKSLEDEILEKEIIQSLLNETKAKYKEALFLEDECEKKFQMIVIEKEKAEKRCYELNNRLELEKSDKVCLAKELQTLKIKIKELARVADIDKSEISTVKQDLDFAKNQIEAQQKKIATLNQSLFDENMEKKLAQNSLIEIRIQCKRNLSIKEECQKKLHILENERDNAEKRCNELMEQLQSEKRFKEYFSKEIEALKIEINERREKADIAKRMMLKVEHNLELAEKELELQQSERRKLDRLLAEEKAKNEDLKDSFKQIEIQYKEALSREEDCQKKFESLENEKIAEEKRCNEIKEQLEYEKRSKAYITKQFETSKKDINELEEKLASSKREVTQLKHDLHLAHNETEAQRNKVLELNRSLSEERVEKAALQDSNDEIRAKYHKALSLEEECQKKFQRLTKEKNNAEKRCKEINEQLESAKYYNTRLAEKIQTAGVKVNLLEKEAASGKSDM